MFINVNDLPSSTAAIRSKHRKEIVYDLNGLCQDSLKRSDFLGKSKKITKNKMIVS